MAQLDVELVSAESTVWSGAARMVVARTTEGELGVLAGHEPLLGLLVEGPVRIHPHDGGAVVSADVDGGFLSVENNRVVVVAERATVSA